MFREGEGILIWFRSKIMYYNFLFLISKYVKPKYIFLTSLRLPALFSPCAIGLPVRGGTKLCTRFSIVSAKAFDGQPNTFNGQTKTHPPK